jgi:hypothetical protein
MIPSEAEPARLKIDGAMRKARARREPGSLGWVAAIVAQNEKQDATAYPALPEGGLSSTA